MRVYRIITRSIIVLICALGILCGLAGIGNTDYYYSISSSNDYIFTSSTQYMTYNGDAYTGIQQSIADVSHNVVAVEERMENVEQQVDRIESTVRWSAENRDMILSFSMTFLFSIAFFIAIEKLIQSIIDCTKDCKQKREEEFQKRLEYMEALKRLETAPEVTKMENL